MDPQWHLREISGGAFDSSLTAYRVSSGAFVPTPIARKVSGDWRHYYEILIAYYTKKKNIEEPQKNSATFGCTFPFSLPVYSDKLTIIKKTALDIDQKILIILPLLIRHFNYY